MYPETSCSQCGAAFGPGTHGFSHCDQHVYATGTTEALKQVRIRTIALHRQALDADLIKGACILERTINKIDAELARRGEYFDAIKADSKVVELVVKGKHNG